MAEIVKVGTAEDMIVRMYNQGSSLRDLQKVDGRTHEQIRQVLLRAGVSLRPVGRAQRNGSITLQTHTDEVIELYVNHNMGLKSIAKQFDSTPEDVRRLLESADVPIRAPGKNKTVQEHVMGRRNSKFLHAVPEMKHMYNNFNTLVDIAEAFGTSPMTVRKLLVDAGVQMRSRGPRREVKAYGPNDQVSAYVKIVENLA